jgi:hypothetical protein
MTESGDRVIGCSGHQAGLVKAALLQPLLKEANELIAIFCGIEAHGPLKFLSTVQITR